MIITEVGEADQLLGKATVVPNKRHDGVFVQDVYVDPQHRLQGIASRIIDRIISDANGATISLEVDSENTSAIHLYVKKGFVEKERVQAKSGKTYLRMQHDPDTAQPTEH